MNSPAEPVPTPAPALPSASVLLLRDRPGGLEVLMTVRGAGAVFGSALVFPGGKLDAADADPAWLELVDGAAGLDGDARARRIAGWREVYEEAGMAPEPCAACTRAADRGAPFMEVVRASGGRLPLDALQPLARWITPRAQAHRFDTLFFLSGLDAEPACDGYEAVSAEWLAPATALAMGEAGARRLLYPTRQQLRWLAPFATAAAAVDAAAARPPPVIEPRSERRAGRLYLTIPRDAGYAVFEEPAEA